ncbi:hypothetical protein APHAL10511_005069 [Amanita phalloides]|nr:hypothetical protein APHAL10511_005069 [Amanita phalloides]
MPSRSGSERDRSRSPRRRAIDLPYDAKSIKKRKYFDELSGDKARSYFRKFVKAWNRGKLSKKYYKGLEPSSIQATTNTAYKWSFADKTSRADDQALRSVREEVGWATHSQRSGDASMSASSGRVVGPTLPTPADLVHARELESEFKEEERKHKRKREKLEAKERIEDMVGPKEVGREGMLEKKRAKREQDRTFREKGDEGFEADESTLMGGGDGFKDAITRRDTARRRYESKTQEKDMQMRERANAMREKERATMDMFQQLAKQRFG